MSKEAPKREYRKELLASLRRMGQRHSTWQVFEDFLAVSAISVSNAMDFNEEREEQYLGIVKQYSKEEVNAFAAMFADLVMTMEEHAKDPCDVLGPIYHELELHNKYTGQFFTPQSVSDMMAEISIGEGNPDIGRFGYFTVSDPACGSGVMLLSAAKATQNKGLSCQKQMLSFGTDIDQKCVHMTYLQLSLYGMPGVVVHGDSLTQEQWSEWYTPIYLLDGWSRKERFRFISETPADKKAEVHQDNSAPHISLNLTEREGGQFSLFQEENLEVGEELKPSDQCTERKRRGR